MRYCNFHTHAPAEAADTFQIVSAAFLPPEPVPDGVWYSLQFHPWDLPETFAGLPEKFTEEAANAPVIGEIGLDRLRGPDLPVQRQYLDALLQFASDCKKPVIFHCVRAFPELLHAVKPYGKIRKLLHGFQGNEEKAKMLTDAGFLLTSRQTLYPGGGLETDAANLSIQEVYDSCKVTEEISVELEDRFFRFLKG
ncbi:MAG: TatD family hydrolase [Lentisphaeria bacterium]|nr:TatD family hydrolase [Lentisphaeria bacterium]